MKSYILLSFLSAILLTTQCLNGPSEQVIVQTIENTDSLIVASDSIIIHTRNTLDTYQIHKTEVNKKLKMESKGLKEMLKELDYYKDID
jgi:fructose-specific phosphotransferase system component IIB